MWDVENLIEGKWWNYCDAESEILDTKKRFDFKVIMYTYQAKERDKTVTRVIWKHICLSSGIHTITTPPLECS